MSIRQCHTTWPVIEVEVQGQIGQTGAIFSVSFKLHLLAAPHRDLWFSTAPPFTSTTLTNSPAFSAGDIVSLDGRMVRPGAALLDRVGLPPLDSGDTGVDVFSVAPGGEILFSLTQDAASLTLGSVQNGDVLSDRGNVAQLNQDLTAAFLLPEFPPVDHGLDGLQTLTNGELFYSLTEDERSVILEARIRKGDLLVSAGQIARSNEQLLSRFHPTTAPSDFGLKAFYVWPGGEVWFSVEEGFTDASLGRIQSGDLLSDQGFVVYRNQELLEAFAPAGATNDLGLRGLYVVTDATPSAPPVVMAGSSIRPQTRDVTLEWQGGGRVFEVEQAASATGPYLPASPIFPGRSCTISLTNAIPAVFFRVRQW